MRFHQLARTAPAKISLIALALTAVVVGCSSDPADTDSDGSADADADGATEPYCGPANTCPVDVTGVDLDTPVVSFKADVFPIFQRTCNDNLCHGAPPARYLMADLELGPADGADATDEELANIVADLTTKDSAVAPAGTKNVVPGDWQNSFLMLKVDGCQNDAGLACAGNTEAQEDSVCEKSCGDGMPQIDTGKEGEFPLSDADRTTIRRWIHQGALAN